jgi:hypothetical protein
MPYGAAPEARKIVSVLLASNAGPRQSTTSRLRSSTTRSTMKRIRQERSHMVAARMALKRLVRVQPLNGSSYRYGLHALHGRLPDAIASSRVSKWIRFVSRILAASRQSALWKTLEFLDAT